MQLSVSDIMPMNTYGRERESIRRRMIPLKRARRVGIGPHATAFFESYETMWHQVHEMLYVEKGGSEQLADELAVYNPLIPNGRTLVATFMFEVANPVERLAFLRKIAGVEDHICIQFGMHTVKARPVDGMDRVRADGKTSAVHFLIFPFTPEQREDFLSTTAPVRIAIVHPAYHYPAEASDILLAALRSDLEDDARG